MSPVTKLPPYSLYLNILGINENNGYYNVSLAITNTGAVSAQLDKFLINQVRQENIAGLTIYLNGTSVNVAEPLNYNLKCGDILQVNFMAPSTNYTSGSQLRICVSTAQALYFTSGTLP
jgi:molybdopterin converting factor small subunit